MFQGCYTALVTPMKGDGSREVDYDMLRRLVDFQAAAGVSGLLAMGTTGESPTLNWEEHSEVIEKTLEFAKNRFTTIAGTGSNCTRESMRSTAHAAGLGIEAVLLVEPYYNGPSSMEIRREYIGPVAEKFPELEIIPYVIPGRSGTQLLPEDLALLHERYDNVNTVKEASGDPDNMRRTRLCAGASLRILSGDDDMTFLAMTDEEINAGGVISVISNVAPAAVQQMTEAVLEGDIAKGRKWHDALKPLLEIVTVTTRQQSPWGARLCKARNPVPVKTLMNLLGMEVGPPRRPLGKMTGEGIGVVRDAALSVQRNNPEVFQPITNAFGVDIDERLSDPALLDSLCYGDE